MNSMIKSGLIGGLGLGVAAATMGYFLTPMMELSEGEQVANIEACAQHLGDTATTIVGDLPNDCDAFSHSIGEYYLPPRSDFKNAELADVKTDEDQRSESKIMAAALGVFGLALGGVAMGASARVTRKEQTN